MSCLIIDVFRLAMVISWKHDGWRKGIRRVAHEEYTLWSQIAKMMTVEKNCSSSSKKCAGALFGCSCCRWHGGADVVAEAMRRCRRAMPT
jgi:hypothetical protein